MVWVGMINWVRYGINCAARGRTSRDGRPAYRYCASSPAVASSAQAEKWSRTGRIAAHA